jgi:hypothetical protein
MKNKLPFLLTICLLGAFVLSGGCISPPTPPGQGSTSQMTEVTTVPTTAPTTVPTTAPTSITFSGTATYINLEGGFWGFIAEDGARYVPVNLPKDAPLEEGGLVVVTAVPVEVSTIQMWGTPIWVTEIVAQASPNPSPVPTEIVGH